MYIISYFHKIILYVCVCVCNIMCVYVKEINNEKIIFL